MPKKLLESAFIELLDIPDENFQQRKYFFNRWAVYIEKEIGLTRGRRVIQLMAFENRSAFLPELAINIKAVIPGNPYNLLENEVYEYSMYKEVLNPKPLSIRFVEQESKSLYISQDKPLCTVVYDTFETNEFGLPIVDESHIPAIESYIKFKVVSRQKLLSALKQQGNYYALRSEANELFREYSTFITNARAVQRFEESERVIESNDLLINFSDGEFNFSE